MKAIDFRNANFEALRAGLDESRARVYAAWRQHGPGTTRGVAHHSGIDLLTLRPRTTELLQLGLLRVCDSIMQPICDEAGEAVAKAFFPATAREGAYEVTPADAWEEWREAQVSGQQVLI